MLNPTLESRSAVAVWGAKPCLLVWFAWWLRLLRSLTDKSGWLTFVIEAYAMDVCPPSTGLLNSIMGENWRFTDFTFRAVPINAKSEGNLHSKLMLSDALSMGIKACTFGWDSVTFFDTPGLRISFPLDCRLPVVVRTSSHIFFDRCSNPAVARKVFRADTYRKQSLSVLKKTFFRRYFSFTVFHPHPLPKPRYLNPAIANWIL